MEKILFISHGDKGGVGKSVTSAMAVEHFLKTGDVALVETDPTQPDVGKRYAGDPDVRLGNLSLNRAGDSENAFQAFGEWLEGVDSSRVVVNLPAGAGETLDSLADLIRRIADDLNYRLVVTYSLKNHHIATDMMLKSLESGLLSVVEPENRFVVFPLFQGVPENFPWFSHPKRKEDLLGEITIPALKNTAALLKLERTMGRISSIISTKPEGWLLVDRASVEKWYKSCLVEMEKLFGKDGD